MDPTRTPPGPYLGWLKYWVPIFGSKIRHRTPTDHSPRISSETKILKKRFELKNMKRGISLQSLMIEES